ncbi:MAG TPA: Uma2 family endonuclease, partial [Pirellulales bacterium]
VRGEVVEVNRPGQEHGLVVMLVGYHLNAFVLPRRLGSVLGADFGIVTERNPDTVRGPDVAFYPAGPDPREFRARGYPSRPPLVVFEIRSPTDRTGELLAKVGELLTAGVEMVVCLDPARRIATVFSSEDDGRRFERGDVLPLPEPLSELRLTVNEWLEEPPVPTGDAG